MSEPRKSSLSAPLALRSLGDGLRLAHVNFFRLYPLALGVELVLAALAGGASYAVARFPSSSGSEGHVLLLISIATVVVAAFLPPLLVTAVVARAVRERMRGRPARPLASLAAGVRRLPVAIVTALALSIIPVASLWIPFAIFGEAFASFLSFSIFGHLLLLLALMMVAALVARLALATPAAVLEGRHLLGAWRRGEQLVEGEMRRVIGLVIVVGVIWAIITIGGAGLTLLATNGSLGHFGLPGEPSSLARVAAVGFVRCALDAWCHLAIGAITTVLYERARRAKDGLDADELSRVFA